MPSFDLLRLRVPSSRRRRVCLLRMLRKLCAVPPNHRPWPISDPPQQLSFLPQMTELSGDKVFIRHSIFNQTISLRKVHQTIDGVARYFSVVKRGVTFDEA